MRTTIKGLCAGLAVALAAACGGTGTGSGEAVTAATAVHVRVSGPGTAMPLVEALSKEYGRTHAGVAFEFISGTNSGGALRGVQEGTLEMAVVNRDLKAEERSDAVSYTAFAREAIAFAAPADRSLEGVTTQQVKDVYAGRLTTWAQLGSGQGPLIVLDRDEDESARKLVLLPVLDGEPVAAPTSVLTKAGEMASALQSTPGAFGYTPVGYLQVKDVQGVRPLELDGVAPTAANVSAGTYPWALTFGLVTRQDAPPGLVDFVRYVNGAEARAFLADHEYAPPRA